MMIEPAGVWTVHDALRAGWELMFPVEHAGFDSSLVLMRHKHDDMHWELGWAREAEPATWSRDADTYNIVALRSLNLNSFHLLGTQQDTLDKGKINYQARLYLLFVLTAIDAVLLLMDLWLLRG
jgi:hypothetical protein